MDTPVLFLIFNRPATAAVVFEKIRQQKPAKLYIAADGPRTNNTNDIENCSATKSLVLEGIDWNCHIKTLFRDDNLGCGKAVSEAITWFFSHEEYGVILEDDTVPDASFFSFCDAMLYKYRDNYKIMHISGCYFLQDFLSSTLPSYYFTKHIHVWGWATWKRAWINYDYSMHEWPKKKSSLKKYFGEYSGFWENLFEMAYTKKIDTWDYQWMFAIFKNNGIAINPTSNLVANIGFGDGATHTSDANSIYTKTKVEPLLNINYTDEIKIHKLRDSLYYKIYLNLNIQSKIRIILCKIFNFLKG